MRTDLFASRIQSAVWALIISFLAILFLYTFQAYGLVASMNWQEVAKIGNTAVMVDAGRKPL
jgi:predicted hydrocarbon binding protein